MRRGSVLIIGFLLGLLACEPTNNDDLIVPTRITLEALETEIALNQTATANQIATDSSATPSLTPTITLPPSNTPTVTSTETPTPSPSNTRFPSRTPTSTGSPIATFTPTDTPTATFTPSLTPTRVTNPDAMIGVEGAQLLTDPSEDAIAVATLDIRAALALQSRSADGLYYQVRLLNGSGNGWVRSSDVIVFIDEGALPIFGEQGAFFTATPTVVATDLITPQLPSPETIGNGPDMLIYNFAACGDTYWLGDGESLTMEDVAYRGRYPRFSRNPIRVYVHGLNPEGEPEWELAISQAFAELSQAVPLQRVDIDDLEFFEPWVPMGTLLLETRVDMVWHIADRDVFASSAPCENPNSCSEYGFSGTVTGGPSRFRGITYVPRDVANPQGALLHAAIHALGLWVHSPNEEDVLFPNTSARRLSNRDIASLRCLYGAPPYGDGLPE